MNLPTVFNIAIGLVFIYLVLSLLASQIQEVIATLLEWRAEQLTRAIENLVLGDTDIESKITTDKTYELVDNLFRNPLIRNLNQTSKSLGVKWQRHFIAAIRQNSFTPKNEEPNRNTINPTYMPAETFSSTVLFELNIPQAARVLTWLNAKRLIHYEIYDKIDKLLASVENPQPKSEKITQQQKDIIKIKPHYEELKKCLKIVLCDYKMERYGLSSTLIRLRTHIETFKREIENEKCFAIAEISLSEGLSEGSTSTQTTKSPKNPIDKIIDFIFTPDKNDSDLVSRLRPSLTTILDLLIPPDIFEPEAVKFIFISKGEGTSHNSDVRAIPNLTNFLELLKPCEDPRVTQVINFIFKSSEVEPSRREVFSKPLYCLISNDTSESDKLKAYQNFKIELQNSKVENAVQLYKIFIEVENHFKPLQAVEFIFISKGEGTNHNSDVRAIPNLTNFLELLKPCEDPRVTQVINFIFKSSEVEPSRREVFSKPLYCLISNDTSESDKLKAYQNFKTELQNSKVENAVPLYRVFIEVENHFMPLAYQSFQIDLRNSEAEAKENDLYDSFTYAQDYFNKISSRLPESLRKSLYELALRSRIKASDIDNQLDDFKQEIETWFDRSMDRASGVYKRNARGFAFLIGFVLAFALNADTFYIVSRLSKDDALRNSIVSTSTQLVQNVQSPNPSPTASQSPTAKSSSSAKPLPTPALTSSQNTIERVKNNVDQSLSDLSLPIGWTDNILDEQLQRPALDKNGETAEQKQNREIQNEKRKIEQTPRRARIFGWYVPLKLIMIMGWLVTATAIMMGAPFWFDFLGLFINVRNTGSRPASKTDKN